MNVNKSMRGYILGATDGAKAIALVKIL